MDKGIYTGIVDIFHCEVGWIWKIHTLEANISQMQEAAQPQVVDTVQVHLIIGRAPSHLHNQLRCFYQNRGLFSQISCSLLSKLIITFTYILSTIFLVVKVQF